jgi:hypothetical protein
MRFGALWAVGAASLNLSARLHRSYTLPPSGKDAARHLTLVARLPRTYNTALGEAIAALQRNNASHYYYPAETIHLTIRNFDGVRRANVDQSEFLVRLRDCVNSCGSFLLRAKGLGVSPDSVFLQLFPEDRSLTELRRRLSSLAQDIRQPTSAAGIFDNFLNLLFRNLAFANLVRFSGVISPPFLGEIRRYRNTCFGQFPIEVVELVETDKLLSNQGTVIVDRAVLADRTTAR